MKNALIVLIMSMSFALCAQTYIHNGDTGEVMEAADVTLTSDCFKCFTLRISGTIHETKVVRALSDNILKINNAKEDMILRVDEEKGMTVLMFVENGDLSETSIVFIDRQLTQLVRTYLDFYRNKLKEYKK